MMLFAYFLTLAHTTRSVSKVFQMATSLEVLAVSVVLWLLLRCGYLFSVEWLVHVVLLKHCLCCSPSVCCILSN